MYDRWAQATDVCKDVGQFCKDMFDLFFSEFFTTGDVSLDSLALDVLHDEHKEKVASLCGIEIFDVVGDLRMAERAQDIRFALKLVERLPGVCLGDIEHFEDDIRNERGVSLRLLAFYLYPPSEPCGSGHALAQTPLEDIGTDAVACLHSCSSFSNFSPLLSLAMRSCESAWARASAMPSSS